MSRALDFEIRYGDADELDNYDPMSDVYNNQEYIGGIQNLIFQKPQFDTDLDRTKLVDEGTDRDSITPYVSDFNIANDTYATAPTTNLPAIEYAASYEVEEYTVLVDIFWEDPVNPTSADYVANIINLPTNKKLRVATEKNTFNKELIWNYPKNSGGNFAIRWNGIFSGVWYTIAVTQSGSYDCKLYAEPKGTTLATPVDSGTGALASYGPQSDIIIGRDDLGRNPARNFRGQEANLRYYNRALSLDELNRARKGEILGDEVNFWPCNQGEGDVMPDIGSSRTNATLTTTGSGFNKQDASAIQLNNFYPFLLADGTTHYEDTAGANLYDVNTRVPALYDNVTSAAYDSGGAAVATNRKRGRFNSYRLNNESAYIDTHTYLTPASGSIAGAAVANSYGTATWTVSGNNLACTASGSCNGVELDNGYLYTFNEGIYGNGSDVVYDVSGSGIHLDINGMATTDIWQQATGETNLGYDWLSIHGGCRFTNGTSAEDIFVPNVVDTDNVTTDSLLPSGYALSSHQTAGKYVRTGSEWLLASGWDVPLNGFSPYRTELDTHVMGTTPMTTASGHYLREQSTLFNRLVLYPANLSEAQNTRLDFDAGNIDSIVALTFKVSDINTLAQLNSSYSKSFKLPATQRNNDIFDYIYDPNSSDFSTIKDQKDTEIRSNGVEILRGKGQVKKVFKKDIATNYEMVVQGDNYNIYTSLDDIAVSGLDLGNFTINQTNVAATWDYTAASGNALFAPIDYGKWNDNAIDLDYLRPSYFVKNILTKGFAEAGFGYESDWLDSDYVGTLAIPFNDEWKLTDASYATASGQTLFTAVSGGLNISAGGVDTAQYFNIAEQTSNPNYSATQSTFNAPIACKMKFDFDFEADYGSALVTYGVALLKFGIEINGTPVREIKSYSESNGEQHSVSTGWIVIQSGDVVKPYVKTAYDVTLNDVTLQSSLSYDIVHGTTIALADYVPKQQNGLSVFDILKGLAESYNLLFYYDPFKRLLKFEPFGSFYSGELNWSSKWNQKREAQNKFLANKLSQEILHQYKEDKNDYYEQEYFKMNEISEPYGSYLHELPRNYKKGRQTIANSIFAATVDRVYAEIGVSIPSIVLNTNDATQDSTGDSGNRSVIRLLSYRGKDAGGAFTLSVKQNGTYTTTNYAYFPRLAFRPATGETWQSLAFDSVGDNNGLFQNNFEPKYRCVQSGITAIYYLNLTERDIAIKPLNKKIYLDSAWWYINQIIDFNPLNDEPTQVELLKIVNYTFTIKKNKSKWVGIVRGDNPTRIPAKPNNDLPTTINGTVASGISSTDDDDAGIGKGTNIEMPEGSNSSAMGVGLKTDYHDQFLVGTFNNPNEDALFQVGGGTHTDGRRNAFEVTRESDGFGAFVNTGRVLTDQYHYTTSGVKQSSRKMFNASGATAGDGTTTIYPTHDNTISGINIFSEITSIKVTPIDASTAYVGWITSYTTSGVSLKVADTSGTGAAVDYLIQIEGN